VAIKLKLDLGYMARLISKKKKKSNQTKTLSLKLELLQRKN
jgi:hypothetical protein